MKFAYFIFIIFVGFNTTLSSQNYSDEILLCDQKIKIIQTTIQTFQKIEKYKDSSSYRYVFLKNKKIKKIEICSIENNIKKKVDFFYQSDVLIYVEKNWTNVSDNKLLEREKNYTNKNELLAWLDKENKMMDTDTNQYSKVCEEVIAYGKSLLLKNQD